MGRGGRTVGSSGTVFFQDNDHSPCLWCVACLDRSVGASCTRRAVLLCRVRKCIDAPLMAGRLGSFVSSRPHACTGMPVVWSFLRFSFFLLLAGCSGMCYSVWSLVLASRNSTGTFWNIHQPGTLVYMRPPQHRLQAGCRGYKLSRDDTCKRAAQDRK